jgi:hypothetical protein
MQLLKKSTNGCLARRASEEIYKNNQWVETNPSNICIFLTDICYLASWYYTTAFADVKYGCLWMLDRLVSTHLKK